MISLNIHDPWNIISDPHSRFTWEYDAVPFYSRNSTLFAILAILYLPMTFSLQHYMKNRTPFQLKTLLKIWNISIALFSIIGTFKLLPTLVESMINHGYLTSICYNSCYYAHDNSWVPPHAAIWVFYFNVSKLPEWVDTFFIVLRKRPLIFLHYYHHIFTFLFCWYANQYSPQFHSAGFFFATTNLAIHSLMYTYYSLCSFGYRPSWNKYLTAAQVLQMIMGIFFLISITNCPKVTFSTEEPENLILVVVGLVMYLSYFLLFMKFYFDRYSNPAKSHSDPNTCSKSPSSPSSPSIKKNC